MDLATALHLEYIAQVMATHLPTGTSAGQAGPALAATSTGPVGPAERAEARTSR